MNIRFKPIFLAILLAISLFSCDKKTEEYVTDSAADYMPLSVGKYIIYRLDSTVFTQFGRTTEVHKYQVKHQVDAQIIDNLGRPAYRVFRFIRDSAGTQPWQANGSYAVTVLTNQVEVNDDNLRVIKLQLPFKDGFSWKGNHYLPSDPYGSIFNFSNDDNMADWDFTYQGPSSFSFNNNNYSNVFTVEQIDESFNVPIAVPTSYAALTRSVDRYSKGIGLVYRQFHIWEYQPNTTSKTGFGITMWMISHN